MPFFAFGWWRNTVRSVPVLAAPVTKLSCNPICKGGVLLSMSVLLTTRFKAVAAELAVDSFTEIPNAVVSLAGWPVSQSVCGIYVVVLLTTKLEASTGDGSKKKR